MKQKDNHILIVDDNRENLKVCGGLLKDNGYQISVATNGRGALELLEKESPDLMLLDVMMPEINGFKLCEQIKKDARFVDTPIIFLTAKYQPDDILEGFKSGGVDYITKPFNREELLIRVKTHLELFQAKKNIVQLNKNRDKLYSVVAHDIRSPLAGIMVTLDEMVKGSIKYTDKNFDYIIELLSQSSRETMGLLNNLLQWTKLQTSQLNLVFKENSIANMVQGILDVYAQNATYKNINIVNETNDNDFGYFDHNTMSAVIRNIVNNAVKFTDNSGTITIKTSQTDNTVNIHIEDTGTGIEPDKLQQIVEGINFASSSGTNKEQGSGLGLTLVRDFIKANAGEFNMSSQPNIGTQVVITLPRYAKHARE